MICDKFQAGPAGPTPNPPCGRLGPTAEDTLLGLLALALAFSGRTPDLDSAAGLLSETFSEA